MIKEKYDENAHIGDLIEIDVFDLTKGSHVILDVKCDVCGKEKKLSYKEYINSTSKYNFYTCSPKCSVEKNKKTNLEKYGSEYYSMTDDFKEKLKNTCLKNYGVESVFQIEEIKNKSKKTKLKKYGDENYNNREKSKETCLSKYGHEIFVLSNYFNYIVNYKNYNKESFLEEVKEKYKKYNIILLDYVDGDFVCKCNSKNHTYKIKPSTLNKRLNKYKTNICTVCNPINSYSETENKLFDFIKENYDDEIIKNDRKILDGKELDIYLPNLNLAFEFNGVYWHSELYKEKFYHKEKSDICENKGIQLIHVWEDDWNYKQEIIKSIILNKLNKSNQISVKKTIIKEIIDNKLIRDFLNNNHIQGFISSSIKLGLFYENELISIMLFKKRNDNYELLRFCNKNNIDVVGANEKLLNYFESNYNVKKIISFVDRSYNNGKLYEDLNFIKEQQNVSFWYLMKDRKIKKSTNKNLLKIYDSGRIKYIKNLN